MHNNNGMYYPNPMLNNNGMAPNSMYPNDFNVIPNIENRLNLMEKKIKVLEQRVNRLEVPYQNNDSLDDDNNVYML